MNTGTIRHLLIVVATFTSLVFPLYRAAGAFGGNTAVSQSEESASGQAGTQAAKHSSDLAIVSVKVPKKVTLSAKKPTVVSTIKVTVQNRSAYYETITDQNTLNNLVSLMVLAQIAGSSFSAPVAALHTGNPQPVLPLILKPNKKLKVNRAE